MPSWTETRYSERGSGRFGKGYLNRVESEVLRAWRELSPFALIPGVYMPVVSKVWQPSPVFSGREAAVREGTVFWFHGRFIVDGCEFPFRFGFSAGLLPWWYRAQGYGTAREALTTAAEEALAQAAARRLGAEGF